MSGRKVSSRSNSKKSGASKSRATSSRGKAAKKSKRTKTVEVSISKRSKRTKSAQVVKKSSKKAAKKVAAKKKATSKKTTTKKKIKKVVAKKTSPKKNASKKTSAKKSTAKKSSKKKATTKKPVSKKTTSVKAKTSSKAASKKKSAKTILSKNVKKVGGRTQISVTSKGDKAKPRQTLSSIIPAPTKEVLKPFRDAAKQTKKLRKDRMKAAKKRGDFLAKQGRKGRKYKIDLRVHTPASLGFFSTGGVDPAPALVRLASVKGLDMIGVTDYYNAAYVDQVRASAQSTKITVLPGFDMRCKVGTCDSITAIALFPSTHCAADIVAVLNELKVPQSAYGNPDYVLEPEFAEVIEVIERSGGLLIPSRVDKTPYRRLAIPALVERFGFHAFDLVHREDPEFFREKWPSGGFTFFSFSNANALGQVGSRSVTVKLTTPGFEGLKELVARRTEDSDSQDKAAA